MECIEKCGLVKNTILRKYNIIIVMFHVKHFIHHPMSKSIDKIPLLLAKFPENYFPGNNFCVF